MLSVLVVFLKLVQLPCIISYFDNVFMIHLVMWEVVDLDPKDSDKSSQFHLVLGLSSIFLDLLWHL